ncbi:MAG: hypothetical protein LBF72_03900 [Holosporales bacterium]|nr:hypothetical protein [Holosporales bacterium]
MSIYFLDLNDKKNLFNLSLDSVKSTDGINTRTATITITGLNEVRHKNDDFATFADPGQQAFWVIGRLVVTFANYKGSGSQIIYNNGEQTFQLLLENINPPPISKVAIFFEDFLDVDRDAAQTKPMNQRGGKIVMPGDAIFEKEFHTIPSNTAFNVTVAKQMSDGPALYTEPIRGFAAPLWYIGGKNSDCLGEIESLFAFPVQKRFTNHAKLETFTLSEIIAKDPAFAFGNTERFAAISGWSGLRGSKGAQTLNDSRNVDPPWNLVAELENGAAVINCPNGEARSIGVMQRPSVANNLSLVPVQTDTVWQQTREILIKFNKSETPLT